MAIATQNRHANPDVGDDVVTMDGQKLGKIQELRGSYFRVRKGHFGHGYWLDDALLYETEGAAENCVTVALLGSQIDEHKVPEDMLNTTLDPRADRLLSEDAMQEQRERMERDLRL